MSTRERKPSFRVTRHRRRLAACLAPLAVVAVAVAMVVPTTNSGAAQAPIGLGAAGSFGVLAGAGITNTGATTINGDIGSFPTVSETGLGTVTLNGADHAGDAVTQQAKTDLTTAFNTARDAKPVNSVPTELGGRTLTPGVYGAGTLGITGTLTLNTLGDPQAVFVFQAASTLVTGSGSNVVVLNGGTACNVYWQVGSSATLGTGSHLLGTVLAQEAITATTGATIEGRLLARTAAVTLDNNTITRSICAAATPTTSAPGSGVTTTTRRATTTTIAGAPAAGPGSGPGPGPGTPGTPGVPATPGTPAATPGSPLTPVTPPLPQTL